MPATAGLLLDHTWRMPLWFPGSFQWSGPVFTWFGFHSGGRDADSPQRKTLQAPGDLV
jgi:hypothetical protein